MKNFSGDAGRGKVYCRFSTPVLQREIASRKTQRPIFHLPKALEIFQARFSTGKSISRRIFRPFALYNLLLKFLGRHFQRETGR
jgi:hypothetical protein